MTILTQITMLSLMWCAPTQDPIKCRARLMLCYARLPLQQSKNEVDNFIGECMR